MKPTIGRIVHYTIAHSQFVDLGGAWNNPLGQSQTVPAVITSVFEGDLVNLTLFVDGIEATASITSQSLAPDGQINVPGHWNWPPREVTQPEITDKAG